MQNSRRQKQIWRGAALLWTFLIWWTSAATMAAGQTGPWLIDLLGWFAPNATPEFIAGVHFAVRKGAHLTYYALGGYLWRNGLQSQPRRIAWVIVVVAAGCDELRQGFIPERTGTLWDVMLDACGAVGGIFLADKLHRRSR